jgi:hypothetical protein
MNKIIREEFIRFWFGLAATAIGVIVALYVDSYADRQRDKDAYRAMIKALNIEALENKIILEQSFLPNYVAGIVHRDFSTKVCEDFVSTRVFLDHAPHETIAVLTGYILNLKRANAIRAADEKYKYNPALREKWDKGITAEFATVLERSKLIIPQVIEQVK